MDKIAVLIPCYNEALTIKKVVEDFRRVLPEGGVVCRFYGPAACYAAIKSALRFLSGNSMTKFGKGIEIADLLC